MGKKDETDEGKGPADDGGPDPEANLSVDEQLVERLKRLKLPEPPAGARERALARYREWAERQPDKSSEADTRASDPPEED